MDFILGLPIDRRKRPGRQRALGGLSLHGWNQALGVNLLDVPLKTLHKITGARRPQDVPAILEDVADALELSGSLEIEKREYLDDNLRTRVAWDWVRRPRIHVKPEFQAQERFIAHNEFWKDRPVTTEQYIELRDEVFDLKRTVSTLVAWKAEDGIAELETTLAEKTELERPRP